MRNGVLHSGESGLSNSSTQQVIIADLSELPSDLAGYVEPGEWASAKHEL